MKKRYQAPANNEILRKALLQVYSLKTWRKNSVLMTLAIKLSEVSPEVFTTPYKRHGQEKDLFFYLKDGKLIGVLEGSKSLNIINEDLYNDIIKNRKHLTANADLILRVPAEQRTYSKPSLKIKNGLSLRERLDLYKINKRKNISKEQIQQKINNAVNLINKNLFSNDINWSEFGGRDGISTLTDFANTAQNITYFDEAYKSDFYNNYRLNLLTYIEKIEKNLK